MIVLGYCGYSRDSRTDRLGRSPLAKANLTFDNLFLYRDGEVPLPLFPLGFFGHDASAALVEDGQIVACAAEERFTRVKHGLNLAGNTLLPRNAIRFCLDKAGSRLEDVDLIAHYCNFPNSIAEDRLTLLKPYISEVATQQTRRSYEVVYQSMLRREAVQDQFARMMGIRPEVIVPVRHHMTHAASAFYASGFPEAVILTMDGTGELESSMLAVGRDGRIHEIGRTLLPTSLGMLYLIVTVFLGFRSLGDEYKIMGLAAYGDPSRYRGFFKSLVQLEANGQYSTSRLAYPDFKEWFVANLSPPRLPDEELEQRHADIAASLQEVLELAVLHTLRHVRAQTGIDKLCAAGGVALNCTLNGAIARSGLFEDIFVQPASSDEGCSVGAALYVYHYAHRSEECKTSRWHHVYFGPEYSNDEILASLHRHQATIQWQAVDDITSAAARELTRVGVISWFQGRMEFGPRALGNRSILADPRDPLMKDRVNALVKRREPFRPFAPAVLEEDANVYFDMSRLDSSPFMLFAIPVRESKRAQIPAVTHVDGTARVQTVSRSTNPLFWELIDQFKRLTGVPVVLNTSFNVQNEPIVCSPEDAVLCFLGTKIDRLAIGNFLVEKRVPQ